MDKCPNCGEKLQTSMFTRNLLLSQDAIDLINARSAKPSAGYCEECGTDLHRRAVVELNNERKMIDDRLLGLMKCIPMATVHHPAGWEYRTVGIVTGQGIIGTGFMSEIGSGLSDMLGGASNRLGNKFEEAEQLCFDKMRIRAYELGGNAVIGINTSYGEVGGGKGMMMACMSGTAVYIENIATVLPDMTESIDRINELRDRRKVLSALKIEHSY